MTFFSNQTSFTLTNIQLCYWVNFLLYSACRSSFKIVAAYRIWLLILPLLFCPELTVSPRISSRTLQSLKNPLYLKTCVPLQFSLIIPRILLIYILKIWSIASIESTQTWTRKIKRCVLLLLVQSFHIICNWCQEFDVLFSDEFLRWASSSIWFVIFENLPQFVPFKYIFAG